MNRDPSRSPERGLGANFGFLASPPSLGRIVARAQVFCALLLRATLEDHPDREEALGIVAAQQEWLIAAGAALELEPHERRLLGTECGALTTLERERCGWLGEAAVMISWALRRTSLPAPGVSADASQVAASLGFLDDSGVTLRTRAQLRSREALLGALELVELADSRLAQAQSSAAPVSLARWRSPGYAWPEEVASFEFVADDLAVDGQPLANLPPARVFGAWRALRERRCAGLWLLGSAKLYSEVAAAAGDKPLPAG